MSIALWILQVLLAAQFLWHGWLMVAPPAELIPIMDAQFAPWFRIFVGVAESLGTIGLILPGITRILPWLTPLAATGLMIVVGSATGMHLSRGETSSGILTAVLFVLLAFVAYMRWKTNPCYHELWLEEYDVQRRSSDGRLWAGIGAVVGCLRFQRRTRE